LKRFIFSEAEEKLVRDAIRTAKMSNPRMKLIHDADLLLKEVAKSREPILSEKEASVEKIVQMRLFELELEIEKKQKEQSSTDKTRSFFGFKTKNGIIFVILITVVLITLKYFQMKPINDMMEKQENLLHGIIEK
jgi:H+/gluconate symporter-like permease